MTYYVAHHLCSMCLGAKRVMGEPCPRCSGTGYDPDQAPRRRDYEPKPVRPREHEPRAGGDLFPRIT